MLGRKSTLYREVLATLAVIHLREWKEAEKDWRLYVELAKELQIEYLYDGDASRWGSCIYCWCWARNGRPFSKPNEHLTPLILRGTIPSMYGDHPFNKAFSCQGCNQEHIKETAIRERFNLAVYIEFVRRNCPRMPYDTRAIIDLFKEIEEECKRKQEQVLAISRKKVPYTEDIDAP